MKGKGPGSAVKIGVIRSWGQPIGNKFSFGSKVLSSINFNENTVKYLKTEKDLISNVQSMSFQTMRKDCIAIKESFNL